MMIFTCDRRSQLRPEGVLLVHIRPAYWAEAMTSEPSKLTHIPIEVPVPLDPGSDANAPPNSCPPAVKCSRRTARAYGHSPEREATLRTANDARYSCCDRFRNLRCCRILSKGLPVAILGQASERLPHLSREGGVTKTLTNDPPPQLVSRDTVLSAKLYGQGPLAATSPNITHYNCVGCKNI